MLCTRPDQTWTYVPIGDRGLPKAQQSEFVFQLPDKDQEAWIKDNVATQMAPAVSRDVFVALCRGWRKVFAQGDGDADVELLYEEEPLSTVLMGSRKRASVAKAANVARFGLGQIHELANAAIAGTPTRLSRDDAGN